MGTICPEEEVDVAKWELLFAACEEDEDSDMPPRKRPKIAESTGQSSAIDSGSKAYAPVLQDGCSNSAYVRASSERERQRERERGRGGGEGGREGGREGGKERERARENAHVCA
jgi:hypothetical protein